jgi:hypothetical protein
VRLVHRQLRTFEFIQEPDEVVRREESNTLVVHLAEKRSRFREGAFIRTHENRVAKSGGQALREILSLVLGARAHRDLAANREFFPFETDVNVTVTIEHALFYGHLEPAIFGEFAY